MDRTEIRPGRGWYIVAAALLTIAIVVGPLLAVGKARQMLKDGPAQYVVPGEHPLALAEAGEYVIFHEYQSTVGGRVFSTGPGLPSGLTCQVRDLSTGQPLTLSTVSMNANYTLGSRAGQAVWSFRVPAPGQYTLSAGYPPGPGGPEVVLTVQKGLLGELVGGVFAILGGACVSLLAGAAALVVFLVVLFKRRGAMRRAQGTVAAPPATPYR